MDCFDALTWSPLYRARHSNIMLSIGCCLRFPATAVQESLPVDIFPPLSSSSLHCDFFFVVAQCCKPSIMVLRCRRRAIACLPRRLPVVVTKQPTETVIRFFIGCHLFFVEQCSEPSLIGMYNTASSLPCTLAIAMHLKCHRLWCKLSLSPSLC